MIRARLLVALMTLTACLTVVSAHAAEGRRVRAMQRRSTDAAAPRVSAPVSTNGRSNPYAGRYPKFQGGFHSRMMQDIGVPTGDTGLRGNGFSMYPW